MQPFCHHITLSVLLIMMLLNKMVYATQNLLLCMQRLLHTLDRCSLTMYANILYEAYIESQFVYHSCWRSTRNRELALYVCEFFVGIEYAASIDAERGRNDDHMLSTET